MYWSPELLGRGFQKARNFTVTIVTRMQDLASEFPKKNSGVISRTLTARGVDPLPQEGSTPSRTQHSVVTKTLAPLNFPAVVAPLPTCQCVSVTMDGNITHIRRALSTATGQCVSCN